MVNLADTHRKFVAPRFQAAGLDSDPCRINEQVTFTTGRIVVSGRRRLGKRADYILRYRADFPIPVIEAKASYSSLGDDLQQAKDYAEILGLKFAYATNGHGIIEFDFTAGLEREMTVFPKPEELWTHLHKDEHISDEASKAIPAPAYRLSGHSPRYYQEIAINRVIQAIAGGRPRSLLMMEPGTGKTVFAFQICWKLWSSRWNRNGDHRKSHQVSVDHMVGDLVDWCR